MIVDTFSDVFNAIAKILFFSDDLQKPNEMEAWKEGILRKFLTIVEGQLERNIMVSKFLVGESMTIADFAVACLVFNILKND